MPARLSVNINKVATVRNSRGGRIPSVLEAARVCIAAGAPGITVHPRGDERHITRADVYEIAEELKPLEGKIEYNIEGDPRPEWLAMVHEVKPDQATLVPVVPGEITSQVGWTERNAAIATASTGAKLPEIIAALKRDGIRVSLFIDADPAIADWAASLGPDRVELYTEPFARAHERGEQEARASFDRYAETAARAVAGGLGINAGHDLDLLNLPMFRELPHLDEVSIGHALISRAIFVGLDRVVREYLAVLAGTGKASHSHSSAAGRSDGSVHEA
jgi:pyridoxine 5-phosphate synthase